MSKRDWLRLPVVSTGAEYLVMGHLMRRNILTYKAPEGNEGYDLICIHPEPRYKPRINERTQVRVQVKSRYATDCDRGFPIREKRNERSKKVITKKEGQVLPTSLPISPHQRIFSHGGTGTRRKKTLNKHS